MSLTDSFILICGKKIKFLSVLIEKPDGLNLFFYMNSTTKCSEREEKLFHSYSWAALPYSGDGKLADPLSLQLTRLVSQVLEASGPFNNI